MKPLLLAVDGLNLIRRLFEARHAQAQTDMAATIESTTQSLQRALRRHQPSHAVVVFEQSERTWRHLLYPQYKAGRSETPRLMVEALPDYQTAFEAIGVACFAAEGYEADDVIATLATVISNNGGRVVILSTDKVYLQLVSDSVLVYDHFAEKAWHAEEVRERYEVDVVDYVDYLALVGDSSNNIKGVPGIGPKTAVQLLKDFGSLDVVLDTDSLDKKVQKVQAARQDALRSRQLVTLKTDVELGINLRSLRVVQPAHTH